MKTRDSRRPNAIATARLPSSARFNDSAPSSDRNPKSKSDVKKWRVRTTSGLIAHGQAPAMVSRICRASGAKSGCSVARTNVSSSESGPSRAKSATRRSSDDPSRRQHDDPRAELLDHVEPVRAEEDHPALVGEHAQQRAEQQTGVDVEAGERLVEHEQLRVVQERGRDAARAAACPSRTPSSTCSGCRAAGAAAAARGCASGASRVGMRRSRPTSIR